MDSHIDSSIRPSLNPAASSFQMPSQPLTATPDQPDLTLFVNGQASRNRQLKVHKGVEEGISGTGLTATTTQPAVADAAKGEQKLSNKELKLRKTAEKQAKRAAQKTTQEPQGRGQIQQQQQQQERRPSDGQSQPSNTGKAQLGQGAKISDITTHHRRTASISGRKPPVKPSAAPSTQVKHPETENRPRQEKKVSMFSHLYSKDRRTTIAGVGREIHPAVLTLGIKLRDFVICGGNARCVATLFAFKKVIQSYTTPPAAALPRHLATHLSHQISYLSSSRPLSTSQGNSIRWLKKLVVELDPEVSDPDARDFLCKSIDQFVREKVSLADEVIAREASQKIVDGDVVLVYAKSSVVEKTLIAAHRQLGRSFSVVVADSRPMFEGKNLARGLARAGLQVQYCLLTGLATLSKKVTKCFLGASAMTENGRLYSRAGTALVAMMAKDCPPSPSGIMSTGPALSQTTGAGTVPVFVLCESVKFSNRVLLDSIVNNELGDPDALIETRTKHDVLSSASPPTTNTTGISSTSTASAGPPKKGSGGGSSSSGAAAEGRSRSDADDEGISNAQRQQWQSESPLQSWTDQPNLHLLNLMYDVTPAHYLDMVITELGSIPPTAVSAVNGVWGGEA